MATVTIGKSYFEALLRRYVVLSAALPPPLLDMSADAIDRAEFVRSLPDNHVELLPVKG